MINNQQKSRFELEIDGHVAYADYAIEGDVLHIKYVFAPPELRGKGAAGNLMKDIVKFAEENYLKINPICAYAASWLRRGK
ncbi:MAG TPA: N-acetyltransferase [Alphaproteobacteria bacterium]|nr:N-acetyltransferase [Alphaproteobacteria bacterium]